MNGNQVGIGIIAVSCVTAGVVAAILLATDAGVPSETVVPILIGVLLALRVQRRRNTIT